MAANNGTASIRALRLSPPLVDQYDDAGLRRLFASLLDQIDTSRIIKQMLLDNRQHLFENHDQLYNVSRLCIAIRSTATVRTTTCFVSFC